MNGPIRDDEKVRLQLRIMVVDDDLPVVTPLRRICAARDYKCIEVPRSAVIARATTDRPDVIVLSESQHILLRELRSEGVSAWMPIVVVTGEKRSDGTLALGADGCVADVTDEAAVEDAILGTIRDKETVESVMRRLDPRAEPLAKDIDCQWFRSRLAIIGVTRIPKVSDATELRKKVDVAVRKTYGLLDNLPEDRLSLEDLWNLLLFVSVPWSQEEAEQQVEMMGVLNEVVQDTSGSRKVILWKGQSLLEHLGPMEGRGTFWLPSSPDPLRDALRAAARDHTELEALEALFKAKITESDLERVIDALGRKIT